MKNLIVIGALCAVAILAGAWFYFASTQDAHHATSSDSTASANTDAPSAQGISFKVLGVGTNAAAYPARKNYAIYDANEFANFWKKAHGNDGTPVPSVDFTKNYVVGVFAGTVSTAGYTIAVSKVTDSSSSRSIEVVIDEPGSDCSVIEEQTNPYQFVSVPFSDVTALSHTDVREKKNCK